jgi:hypothetical protein
MRKKPGQKIKCWANIYPRPDSQFFNAVLFPTKALADSFAVPSLLSCKEISFTVGEGLDAQELEELQS